MFSQRSVTRSGKQENGQPHGLSRRLLHSLKRATYSSARITEPLASRKIIQEKVMLRVILNRLKPQAEEISAEEQQVEFRVGRSTTEQIFNLRILCEKYLQHQQNLYHVLIDFKKAFDRVWHAALWATMKKYMLLACYHVNLRLVIVI